MGALQRSLALFFSRELDRLGGVVAFLRHPWRRASSVPGPRGPSASRRRLEKLRRSQEAPQPAPVSSPAAVTAGARAGVPAGDGVVRWAGLTSFGSSITLHALAGFLLLQLRSPAGAPPDPADRTIVIHLVPTVHRTPPEKPFEVQPEPDLSPPEPEKQPGPPTDDPSPAPPSEGEESGTAEDDPRPGMPDAPDIESAEPFPELAQLPLPTSSLGLGESPPPIPRTGTGAARGFGTRLGGKAEALRRHGGGGKTESAVERGLRWLSEHQDADGGWSASGFQRHCKHTVPCPGKGQTEFDVGITALSVLAFLGGGHYPLPPGKVTGVHSPYQARVTKALDYLLAHQDSSGAFGALGDNYLYNHALATFAVAEAHTVAQSRRYAESLRAAIAFSAGAQQAGGGWDYTSAASGRNDLSITGWQIMALRSASSAGVEVPDGVFGRCRDFLSVAVTPAGEGIYANMGQEAGRRGINMVAVGLLSKLYLGSGGSEGPVRHAAERLIRTPPDWKACASWETSFQSYYHWYTATLALFHLGGKEWKAWNFFLQKAILPLQSLQPHEEGSWPPESSWVGISGGRVYSTAICVLTLETYYRYEPLLGRKS